MQKSSATAHAGELSHSSCRRAQPRLMQKSLATAHAGELSTAHAGEFGHSSCRRAQPQLMQERSAQLMQESSATAHAGEHSTAHVGELSHSSCRRAQPQLMQGSSHNQNHPTQIPNYGTIISSRTAVLKTTHTQKPVPTNNNFYRNYSLNQPTTRVNCHDHFMALNQRLTRVGENPYL